MAPGGPIALPAKWDAPTKRARVPAAPFKEAGGSRSAAACVCIDESEGLGPLAKRGRLLRGQGRATLRGDVVSVALEPERITRWKGFRTLVASGSGSIAGAARTWPRRAMVVVEVAMGVVLLVGAGLLIRTLDHLLRLQAGFDGTHVMTATLSLDDARYRTAARVNQLFERTLDRMRALPGVESAAVALTLPYERALNVGWAFVGAERQQRAINMTYVTPHYFETLRIPLLRGRAFAPTDAAPAPAVIIVNQAFVNAIKLVVLWKKILKPVPLRNRRFDLEIDHRHGGQIEAHVRDDRRPDRSAQHVDERKDRAGDQRLLRPWPWAQCLGS